MKHLQDSYLYHGTKVNNAWIKTSDVSKFSPIMQVYGIIFNDKNEILVCRESKEGHWIIPGGHPEKRETIELTLKRELLEEVDVEVKDIRVLGTLEVTFPDSPEKGKIYQVRCVCKLNKLLPQTPDPANGHTWERKFVPASEITNYVKWGVTGEAMSSDAISLNKTL